MAVFKCKMCGGTIEFEQGATVGICDSCGTKQTLPRLDDDRKANLYDRANHFRRNNDFDKAVGIYEQILNEDNTDAEAYWSLVLCRYGIEYVEDPATHRRMPTVNRAQFTSIYMDEDYKSALKYADGAQRAIYEEEAEAIDDIQKSILAISSKEAPFDVFICYKETDTNGRRTQDSVLANELYHQLTQEGFKVFFSRMKRHCENAQAVAEFLSNDERVAWIRYCGLPGDKYYALGQKYLPNGSCGVVSFGVKGGREAAEKFMANLRIAAIETHVADARTCCLHPASTTHRQLTDTELNAAGVSPDLIRLSCGLEDAEDLIADIDSALAR